MLHPLSRPHLPCLAIAHDLAAPLLPSPEPCVPGQELLGRDNQAACEPAFIMQEGVQVKPCA